HPCPSQIDPTVGSRGGPRDPGRPDPRARRDGRRAPTGRGRGEAAGRLGLAAEAPRDLAGGAPGRAEPRRRCSAAVKQMYHPSDLAAMDPLVLLKNLDHVRMTSRRLSYILQQQVHLYTPEANQLREEIDGYVEAERQIEGEMARRRIRA